MRFGFEIKGETPLLFNGMNVDSVDRVSEAIRLAKEAGIKTKAGDDRFPTWTWATKLHHDGTHVALPQEVIMTTLRNAAAKIPLPNGRSNESFKKLSQSGIVIRQQYCRFTAGGKQVAMADIVKLESKTFAEQKAAVRKIGFDIFVNQAKPPGKTSRHVRCRPRFDDWAVDGVLEVSEPQITSAILEKMFQIAGIYCGFLDWRPNAEKGPGPYGQFTAKLKKLSD